MLCIFDILLNLRETLFNIFKPKYLLYELKLVLYINRKNIKKL